MLALSFTFLAGRYHATQWGKNVNEGLIDWPPSPWRILRAIISVWKNKSADITHDQMWPILKTMSENKAFFYVPKSAQSHTRHYMPQFLKNTSKIIDSFMVINTDRCLVVMWKGVSLNKDQKKILDLVINNMSYFGRAESWCKVQRIDKPTVDDYPKPNVCMLQDQTNTGTIIQVLVPKNNVSFEQLCVKTNDLHKKQILVPPGSQWMQYVMSEDVDTLSVNTFQSTTEPEINIIRYSIGAKVRPKVTESLYIGDSLKRAVMTKYGKQNKNESSYILSGKQNNKVLKNNHEHAFFLPTDEDEDNILDHLTIVAKKPFDQKEIKAISETKYIGYGENRLNLIFQGYGGSEDFSNVKILKSSKKWVSSTPFVLNRHIKKNRVSDYPENQLITEIKKRHGDSIVIKNVRLDGLDFNMKSGLKPIQFKRWRKDKLPGFGAYSISIEFEKEISGPLCFGHASHFGLGMLIADDINI